MIERVRRALARFQTRRAGVRHQSVPSVPHIHLLVELTPGEVVEVQLDIPAYVRLLDHANYARYHESRPYEGRVGYHQDLIARIDAPAAGAWHLAVDLGPRAIHLQASYRVLPPEPTAQP